MIKVGLIGLGGMGKCHLGCYKRLMEQGFPVELVAVCDIEPVRFQTGGGRINLELADVTGDCDAFRTYTDMKEMVAKESLDMVDICLPSFLHADTAIWAMRAGLHVLSEKPMALRREDCLRMEAAAAETGRTLMVAQCLRFWPHYEYLKACIDDGRYGKVLNASFYRLSGMPKWSWEDWFLDEARSGGCLFDMHVHDVDVVNWLFGMPKAVSTRAGRLSPEGGYTWMTTAYRYAPEMVVTAQADWAMDGSFAFRMQYRVVCEKAALVYEDWKLTVFPFNGDAAFEVALEGDAYEREIRYLVQAIRSGTPVETATPESTRRTIELAEAEKHSADLDGEWVAVAGA